MSESLFRQTVGRLYRTLWALSLLWGIVLGCYVVYASLFGDAVFGLVGQSGLAVDGWWWAFGVLLILQSIWYFGKGP